MIKVCGHPVENCPPDMEDYKDDLMLGIIDSQCMNFIKTSLDVYGKTEEEILTYARYIKNLDSTYDTVSIYAEMNDITGERDFRCCKRI